MFGILNAVECVFSIENREQTSDKIKRKCDTSHTGEPKKKFQWDKKSSFSICERVCECDSSHLFFSLSLHFFFSYFQTKTISFRFSSRFSKLSVSKMFGIEGGVCVCVCVGWKRSKQAKETIWTFNQYNNSEQKFFYSFLYSHYFHLRLLFAKMEHIEIERGGKKQPGMHFVCIFCANENGAIKQQSEEKNKLKN